MNRPAVHQATRLFSQAVRRTNANRLCLRLALAASSQNAPRSLPLPRAFSASPLQRKGIMPETDNPTSEAERTDSTVVVAELSESEYHELADIYLDNVLSRIEELQDKREDLDIEYSAGVMTIAVTGKGTYVINKQPPNKQIWLSSPISGPKRYDWCVVGDGQGDKEGTASGHWIYSRDGSTLDSVFLEELEVDLSAADHE
ncbi:Frataxin [Paramyrothecium foliicola]|nr:Frataxin [Paramyrothecium foliicola]